MGDGDEGRLWVGGLPERVTEDDVKYEYQKYGDITDLIVRHNTGKCAYAFLTYADPENAVAAMKETNQAKLFGMPFIKVAWSGPKKGKGGGKGSGKGKRRSSNSRSRSPRRRSRSPVRRSPRRHGQSRSPIRRNPSRPRSKSPIRRSSFPAKGKGKGRSPPRRRGRSPSPRRRSPSPRRRSPTPRGRSPSPRKYSPSPKRGSPTPKLRPRNASPTPERHSPPPPKVRPRSASPTPERHSPPPRPMSPSPPRKYASPPREKVSASPECQRAPPATDPLSPSPPRRSSPPRKAVDVPRVAPAGANMDRRRDTYAKPERFLVTVEHLPEDMDSEELKDIADDFAKVGQCKFAKVVSRVGTIEFTAVADMFLAIKKLDKRRVSGTDVRMKAFETPS